MPEKILLSLPESTVTIPPDMGVSPSDSQLVRRAGVEVVGNWVIDRDLNVVRRRYWGKVPAEGIERLEA